MTLMTIIVQEVTKVSLRDRLARRQSHVQAQSIQEEFRPATIRPQSAMEQYIGTQEERLDSPRAQRLFERALRVETRYERRKRK